MLGAALLLLSFSALLFFFSVLSIGIDAGDPLTWGLGAEHVTFPLTLTSASAGARAHYDGHGQRARDSTSSCR